MSKIVFYKVNKTDASAQEQSQTNLPTVDVEEVIEHDDDNGIPLPDREKRHELLVFDNRELVLAQETDSNEEDITKKAVFVPRSHLNSGERKHSLLKLRSYLEKDFKAADIKWSLFVAASQSHRFDKVLQPFPPSFLQSNNDRDIEALQKVISKLPPLTLLLKKIRDVDTCDVNDVVIRLLNWLLVRIKYPYLETLDSDCFRSVLSRVPSEMPIPKPDFIFEIVTCNDSPAEHRWNRLTYQYETHFGYHGSSLENFHCIIHFGLLRHLNKEMRKGKGVYLSKELSVIVPHTPTGYAWGASKLGAQLSCVALCEYFDNDDHLTVKESTELFGSKRNLVASEEPNKYDVVTNASMIRVRYLLVYVKSEKQDQKVQTFYEWCMQRKVVTGLILYLIFVLIVVLNYYCGVLFDRLGL